MRTGDPSRTPATRAADRPLPPTAVYERAAAVIACVIVAARFPIQQALTVGIVMALALSPVWTGALRRYRGAAAVVVLGVLALASGVLLTGAKQTTNSIGSSTLQINSLVLLSLVAGIGTLLWARTVLGTRGVATWFGVGLLIGTVFSNQGDNAWKYAYSVPVIVLVLALCMRTGRRTVELLALIGLAVVSAANDSRSATSVLAMAAAMTLWQPVRSRLGGHSTPARTLVTFAMVGLISFAALQTFILNGVFGESAMERTAAQIQVSGSVVTGGRPEIGATLALFLHSPLGYGSGTLPSVRDVLVAKGGMQDLNYQPDNRYVEGYLFGNGFELHSVIGDLWARFGLVGLALALTLLTLIILGAASRVADGTASALLAYLTIQAVWDLFFSPFFVTSIATLSLATTLALSTRDSAPDSVPDSPPRLPPR